MTYSLPNIIAQRSFVINVYNHSGILIISLLMHVAHGNIDYWAVNTRRLWQRSMFLTHKNNKESLAGEGFEPATICVMG
jgi:hypothetical protein